MNEKKYESQLYKNNNCNDIINTGKKKKIWSKENKIMNIFNY